MEHYMTFINMMTTGRPMYVSKIEAVPNHVK